MVLFFVSPNLIEVVLVLIVVLDRTICSSRTSTYLGLGSLLVVVLVVVGTTTSLLGLASSSATTRPTTTTTRLVGSPRSYLLNTVSTTPRYTLHAGLAK